VDQTSKEDLFRLPTGAKSVVQALLRPLFGQFLEEFFSETGAVLASYASDPDAPFCDEVSSKEARDP
jgi:hypothetical protein